MHEIDVYDFTSNTWSVLTENIPTPRAGASVVNFNDKLWVIGGEVENEMINGILISDALKVTETYDPVKDQWNSSANMNNNRHGTQALVSGKGIFTIGGSPKKGGGNQKKMEYLGKDEPIGQPLVPSEILIDESVQIYKAPTSISLNVINGNMGVFIDSIKITGQNSANFVVNSNIKPNSLLKSNSSHPILITYTGNVGGETATLLITYGPNKTVSVLLESTLQPSIVVKTAEPSTKFSNTVQEENLFKINLFPNPASSEIDLQVSEPLYEIKVIRIYTLYGS